MIELYTDATPNGLKVSIALEEMGFEYDVHRVFLGGEQMTPEFTDLNPNNKIPVLDDDGLIITESGAILIYLAEKSGKLLPSDPKARTRTIEMVMFQMASLGPMFGQYLVFAAAWNNEFPKVTDRYFKEVSRILGVLEARLGDSDYFAGGQFTIADVAIIPWIRMCVVHPAAASLPFSAMPRLTAWWERVSVRPSVVKGLATPEPFPIDKQFAAFVDATIGLGDLHG